MYEKTVKCLVQPLGASSEKRKSFLVKTSLFKVNVNLVKEERYNYLVFEMLD